MPTIGEPRSFRSAATAMVGVVAAVVVSMVGVGLFPTAMTAQQPPIRIPVAGRPATFYNAIGRAVTIQGRADRTTVDVDQPIVWTVTVGGLMNAEQVIPPNLQELPEFQRDFVIEFDRTPPARSDQVRVFRWTLRPRRADVAEIPELTFPYYDPDRPQPPDQPSFPFRRVRTEATALTVRSPKATTTDLPRKVPMTVPAFAKAEPSREWTVPGWVLILVVIAGPLGAIIKTVHERMTLPSSAWAIRRRRSRSARTALSVLADQARRESPSLRSAAVAAARFLSERFDRPGLSHVPSDVRRSLAAVNMEPPVRDRWVAWFAAVDEMRFGTADDTPRRLINEAESLIHRTDSKV